MLQKIISKIIATAIDDHTVNINVNASIIFNTLTGGLLTGKKGVFTVHAIN